LKNDLKSLLIGAFTAGLGIATGFTGASGKATTTFLVSFLLIIHDIIYLENNL
jgi:hypothetical protein